MVGYQLRRPPTAASVSQLIEFLTFSFREPNMGFGLIGLMGGYCDGMHCKPLIGAERQECSEVARR